MDPQILQQMVDAGLVDDRTSLLAQRMKRAQALQLTPGAEGMKAGGTYVASSPLEHLASAMSRIVGGQRAKGIDQQMSDLVAQKGAGRMAFAQASQQPDPLPVPQQAPVPALPQGNGVPSMLARPPEEAPAWSPPSFGADSPPTQPSPDALIAAMAKASSGPAPVAPPARPMSLGAMGALSGDPAIAASGSVLAGEAQHAAANAETARKNATDEFHRKAEAERWARQQTETERSNLANEDIRRSALLLKPSPGAGGYGGMGQASPDDINAVADAIVEGTQPPSLSELRSNTTAVRAALAKRGYDLTTASTDWTATQKHMASLNGNQQLRLRQAVGAAGEQLDNVEKLYREWTAEGANSGIRQFNRAAIAASKQVGGKAGAAAQALDGQIALLTGELGNVLMGGNSPTDHALELAKRMLSGDWNEEQFKKAVGQLRVDLRIRSNSLAHTSAAGTSPTNQYGPKAEAGPAPGAPAAERKMVNGKTYEKRADGWYEVQ